MSRRELLLDRIRPALVCPTCRSALGDRDRALVCDACGLVVPCDGAFRFPGLGEEAQEADWLNAVKAAAKHRLGQLYPLAMAALAPVYGDSGLDDFLATFGDDALVCDLGAGTRAYDDRVVCLDGYGYPSVHVVCDLAALPLADSSIDGAISVAVLEHVPEPAAHVAEMFRVLRPGGRVRCFFPFMQAFHASPHDYSRLTMPGLLRLFEAFVGCRAWVAAGPTSGLIWTLQEWIAIAGSFGSTRLYRALVPLTWVLSPLKYLDKLLIKHPAAHTIASGFAIEAIKPGTATPAASPASSKM